jgi:hypothetical protein
VQRGFAADVVVGVSIETPGGDAKVARSQLQPQGLLELLTIPSNIAVGQVQSRNKGLSPAQSAKSFQRFTNTSTREIDRRDRGRAGMRSFAIGHRDDFERDAFRQEMLNQATGPKHLVVGMRGDNEHATRPYWCERREIREAL